MKKILLTLSVAWLTSGCVLSPDGNFYPAPNLDVGVGVGGNVDIAPRIFNGTRSNVTVWLHPTYTVADAYPIAQAHCARWGFYARPTFDWRGSATIERRLNYSCVNYRPVLSGPHIIVGSPFYRNHYRHWHNGRRFGRRYPRRGTIGGRVNSRPYRSNRVYTPKTRPRYTPPARRGTFGRVLSPSQTRPPVTRTQRGKPWERNVNKNKAIIPNPGTTVQRGKPWENNRRKGTLGGSTVTTPTYKSKRPTFGRSGSGVVREKSTYKSKTRLGSGFGSGTVKPKTTYKSKSGFGSVRPKTSYKSKSGFGSVKPKNSSRRSRKGRLTL